MRGVERFIRTVGPARRRLFMILEAVLFVLVITLVTLTVIQVFSRYVLHNSLPWTEEAARIALVWTVMIGAAIAAERRDHYAITFISDRFSPRLKFIAAILMNTFGLIFLVVLAKYGMDYVLRNMNTVYIATQVTKGFVFMALPTGAFIMALALVMHTLEALALHMKGQGIPDSGSSTMEA